MIAHASVEEILLKVQQDFISADIDFSLYDSYDSAQQLASCQYTWELGTKNSMLRESITKEMYAEGLREMIENHHVQIEDLELYGDDLMFPYEELRGIL